MDAPRGYNSTHVGCSASRNREKTVAPVSSNFVAFRPANETRSTPSLVSYILCVDDCNDNEGQLC